MARWLVGLALLASSSWACAARDLSFGKRCTDLCDEGYVCVSGVCLPDAAEGEGEGEGEGEPVNVGPTMLGETVVMLLPGEAGRTASGQLLATDPDGDPLTFSVVTPPEGAELTLDAATGAFEVTSAATTAANLAATVEVSDGVATDRADIVIVIVNFAPTFDARAIWRGTVSESVDEVGNWEPPSVPTPIMDVFIPQDAERMPSLADDVNWRGLYVENGAFIEAGTRSITLNGGEARPCFIGGEIRSTALEGGLRVDGVHLAGTLPTVSTFGSVVVAAPTRAAKLDVDSEAAGFSVVAPLHVLGDAVMFGFVTVFVTDTRVVVDGDLDLSVIGGGLLAAVVSGGELRFRRDVFIHRNVTLDDGARVVFDGPGPQRVASVATLIDVEVASDVTLVELGGADPRLSVFNSLLVTSNGHIATDVVTLTLLPDAVLELQPGAEVSGALVEVGGPVIAQDALWNVERTRLKSNSVLPWPTDLGLLDVEVAFFTTVQLGGPAVVEGNLDIIGTLEVGEQQLDVAGALTVTGDGRLSLVDPVALVTVGGDATLGGFSPSATFAAGLVQVAGDLSLSSLSDVVSYTGPDFTFLLTGAATVTLDPLRPCAVDSGNNCRITNLTIAEGAAVALPPLIFVEETLRVEGDVLLNSASAVVGDLELAATANITSAPGGCGVTSVQFDPGTPSERQTCTLYVAANGSCSDEATDSRCP